MLLHLDSLADNIQEETVYQQKTSQLFDLIKMHGEKNALAELEKNLKEDRQFSDAYYYEDRKSETIYKWMNKFPIAGKFFMEIFKTHQPLVNRYLENRIYNDNRLKKLDQDEVKHVANQALMRAIAGYKEYKTAFSTYARALIGRSVTAYLKRPATRFLLQEKSIFGHGTDPERPQLVDSLHSRDESNSYEDIAMAERIAELMSDEELFDSKERYVMRERHKALSLDDDGKEKKYTQIAAALNTTVAEVKEIEERVKRKIVSRSSQLRSSSDSIPFELKREASTLTLIPSEGNERISLLPDGQRNLYEEHWSALLPSERQVLLMHLDGRSREEIAAAKGVNLNTVDQYFAPIRLSLGQRLLVESRHRDKPDPDINFNLPPAKYHHRYGHIWNQLTPNQKYSFYFHLEGKTLAEIAKKMSTNVDNVRDYLRAVKKRINVKFDLDANEEGFKKFALPPKGHEELKSVWGRLTLKEKEVLSLHLAGTSYSAIAKKLGIEKATTLRDHFAAIRKKTKMKLEVKRDAALPDQTQVNADDFFAAPPDEFKGQYAKYWDKLGYRERIVFALHLDGKTSAEIQELTGLSKNSVARNLSSVRKKTGLEFRANEDRSHLQKDVADAGKYAKPPQGYEQLESSWLFLTNRQKAIASLSLQGEKPAGIAKKLDIAVGKVYVQKSLAMKTLAL